jgi:hypothetical protein
MFFLNLNLLLNSFNWNGTVSLFIACIEILVLINLLIFAEKNKINKIIFLIIALLASYQTFEFLICNLGMDSSLTAYLAFAVITFLPPLSLLLILKVSAMEIKFYWLIFLPALFFIIYYFFVVEQFVVVKCTVLYATYNYPLGDLYGFFYYTPVLISLLILLKKKKALDKKQFTRLFIAYLFIITPVVTGFALMYLDFPDLVISMESILCKFAFGYAIFLALYCLNNRVNTSNRNHTLNHKRI